MSQFDFRRIRSYLLPESINERIPMANIPNEYEKIRGLLEEVGVKVIETALTFGTEIPDTFSAINILIHSRFDLMKVYEYLSDQRNFRWSKNVYPLTEKCGVCNSERVDVFYSTSCNHGACIRCYNDHIFREMAKIEKGETEVCRCIGSKKGKCRVLLNDNFMKGLGAEFREALRRIQVEYFLQSKAIYRCCLRIYYNPVSQSVKDKLITMSCSFCRRETCFSCKNRYPHVPLPCELLEDFNNKSRTMFPHHKICTRTPIRYEICQFCKPTQQGGEGEVVVGENDFVRCPKCYSRWCYKCGRAASFLERSQSSVHLNCSKTRNDTTNWRISEVLHEIDMHIKKEYRSGQTDFVEAFIRYSHYMGLAKDIHDEMVAFRTLDEDTSSPIQTKLSERQLRDLSLQFVGLKFLSNVIVLKYYLTTVYNPPRITRCVDRHFKDFRRNGTQDKFINFEISDLENILKGTSYVRSEQVQGKLISLYRRIYDLSKDKTLFPTEKEYFIIEDMHKGHMIHLPDFLGDRNSPFTITHYFVKNVYHGIDKYRENVLIGPENHFPVSNAGNRNFAQGPSTMYQANHDLERALRESMRLATPASPGNEDPELYFALLESQRMEEERLKRIEEESKKVEEERKTREERELEEALKLSQMQAEMEEKSRQFQYNQFGDDDDEGKGEEYFVVDDDDFETTDGSSSDGEKESSSSDVDVDVDVSDVVDDVVDVVTAVVDAKVEMDEVSESSEEDGEDVDDGKFSSDDDEDEDLYGDLKGSRKKKEEEEEEEEEFDT